jgi:FkbM family methyltransferase
MNIGANKGYTMVEMLSLWGKQYAKAKGLDVTEWRDQLHRLFKQSETKADKGIPGDPVCGACNQCKSKIDWYQPNPETGDTSHPKIYAYEPLSGLYPILKELVQFFKLETAVQVKQRAFGKQVGHVEFPKCSAFHEDCGIGVHGTDTEMVQLSTVDNEIELNKIEHVDILFVDTEGNDWNVLQGTFFVFLF